MLKTVSLRHYLLIMCFDFTSVAFHYLVKIYDVRIVHVTKKIIFQPG